MKPSELKKNDASSIRFNSEIRKVLKSMGLTIQEFFDENVNKVFKVEVDKVRRKRK